MSTRRKKERRKLRYQRNVKKEFDYKNSAWQSGKLIEENHNGKYYSPEYSKALCYRLYKYIGEVMNQSMTAEDPGRYILKGIWRYKTWIINLILKWSDSEPTNEYYDYLKRVLETYWDDIQEKCDNPCILLGIKYPEPLINEPEYRFSQ